MKRADFIFNTIRVPLDFAMLIVAGLATYGIRTRLLSAYRPVLFTPNLPPERFILLVLIVSALFVFAYALSGLYSMRIRITRAQEVLRIIIASSAAIMVVIMTIFLSQELFNSRFLVIGYWGLAMLFVLIGRTVLRAIHTSLIVRRDIGARRVLLIGNDGVTEHLLSAMNVHRELGWRVVRRLVDPDMTEVAVAVSSQSVDEVILANPDYPAAKIVELVDYCHEHHVVFKFVPNIYQTLTTHYDVDSIDRIPVVELRRTALDGWGRVFKRLFDIIFSVVALALLWPFFILIGIAIKSDSSGPVFVRLRRVSRNTEFPLLKFRSMVKNAEELKTGLQLRNERSDGPLFKMKDDPRITRVGRFLRRYRLDELPQFWNVLKGQISVVGPRPHQPDEIARYAKHHRKVLAIKAGATGMAQASGASDLPFEEEVSLDTFYIENWSLMLDVRLVLKTLTRMVMDRSAV